MRVLIMSLYRFPNTDMIKDPRTKHFCENGDTFNGWIGPDVHFLFSTIKNGQDCCWVLTHKVSARFCSALLGMRSDVVWLGRMKPTSKSHGPSLASSKTYIR